jgi:hypothetical protein
MNCVAVSPALFWRKNVNNLFGIDYHARAFEEYPNLAASGLVCDCRYFGLYYFAAVKFDPDAGVYAVIHIVSILP